MLSAGSIPTRHEHEAKPYSIVRAETSNALANADDNEKEASQEQSSDSEDEPEELVDLDTVEADPLIGGEEDYGKGVARKMIDKIGASVFRGTIIKVSWTGSRPSPTALSFISQNFPSDPGHLVHCFQYKDNNENEDCDPTGSFYTMFTDGSKMKMDGIKANKARRLFETEANRLVACGMPRDDVCNSLMEYTTAGLNVKSKVRQPVLTNGEDEDPQNYEQIFEEKFNGKVPDQVVGLMFDSKWVRATDALNNDVDVQLWEKVLM